MSLLQLFLDEIRLPTAAMSQKQRDEIRAALFLMSCWSPASQGKEKGKKKQKPTAHKRMIKSETKEKHLAIKIALNLVRLNLLNKHNVNKREGNGSECYNGVKEMEVPKTQ